LGIPTRNAKEDKAMKQFGKIILSATTFAIMAVAVDTVPVYAQASLPVRVVNTPLPVTVGGSVTVGNPVTIGGPVTIGNPVTIGGPVTVGNPVENPVLTRDVDNPAEEPFEFYLCEGSGTWGSYCPPGGGSRLIPTTSDATGKTVKRFVAEYASGSCQAAADTYLTQVSLIRTFSYGNGMAHYFVPVNVGTPGANNYTFGQLTRLYYDPGQSVTAGVARVGADQYCIVAVSGHFVTE
jgi:hypothetical protein